MTQELDALKLHEKLKGKLEIKSKQKITSQNLSLLYTPGVSFPCMEINKNPVKANDYTIAGNTVAVISDGTAVLGLGNIGAKASLPVMEGKSILFKELAGVNAFPIVLNTKSLEENIKVIKAIAPTFAAINLEDFSAPDCFEIENSLQELGIPVVHDDQHATAIVVLAGLINACKLTGKKFNELKIVLIGVGAAGTAVIKLLFESNEFTPKKLIAFDRKGALNNQRTDLIGHKKFLAELTECNFNGLLKEALEGADVFIGLSSANLLKKEDIQKMNKPIIFALANPFPEINPEEAIAGGAVIVATGRSDYCNQVNNALVFPALFKGLIEGKAKKLTPEIKLTAAKALADSVKPTKNKILPKPLDKNYVKKIAEAVKKAIKK
ncbi:MAG: NADP-dependent malic enzyme [Candidatus Diapherotrites archaeon]|nr:NADP-dependent malic enzyme [Candidatus Diapherotrites archaeon]